ncbi:MAG: DUF4912 domain-containing protein [Planctomycetaceae bacterium]|nr:DUF4912 domain-containing protein [Planctomycetaceae bacterium]
MPQRRRREPSISSSIPDSVSSESSGNLPGRSGKVTPHESENADLFETHEVAANWYHVCWEISEKTRQRAIASLKGLARKSQLVIRSSLETRPETGTASVEVLATTTVDESAQEWFLRLPRVEGRYQLELGRLTQEKFFTLARTTVTPSATAFRSSAERCPPLSSTSLQSLLSDTETPPPLTLTTAIEISGQTSPASKITVNDLPVTVDDSDGRFLLRLPAVSGRMVHAVVATAHGRQQRGLIAVEVNTHLLEVDDEVDE